MAVKTTTLGSVILTDAEAKAFRKQFIENPPKKNPLAQNSLERGVARMKEFEKNGFIFFDIKNECLD